MGHSPAEGLGYVSDGWSVRVKDDRDPTKIGQVIIERPPGVTACQAADWALEGIKPKSNGKVPRGMKGHITRLKHDS